MAKQSIDFSNRSVHIIVSDSTFMLPADNLFPANDLFPAGIQIVSNVVYGSMTLDELIVDDELVFGNLYSTKFEAKLYDTEDLSGKYIAVYQQVDDVATYIFSGYVDSCKLDKDGLDRTIVAYDEAYIISSKNAAPWWTQFWSNRESATLKQCRDSMLTYFGIQYEDVELPNDRITVTKNVSMTSITFGNMLKMMCEINCCFPHFNRDGSMEFIICDVEEEPIDLEGLYEGQNSNFEEYTTDDITGIAFYDSEGELKYVVGERNNVYSVGTNIFLYSMGTTELETVGNNMLDYISEFHFKPSEVKMIVGDFQYDLGKKVSTEKGSFYIFHNEFSGSQFVEQTMSATGKQSLGESSRPQSVESNNLILNEKYSRLEANVEHFEVDFGDALEGLQSEFELTAGELRSEISKKNSTYNGRYTPTASNAPANEWTTEAVREDHEGDIFYDESTGTTYRWGKSQDGVIVKFNSQCYTEACCDGVYLYYYDSVIDKYPISKFLAGNGSTQETSSKKPLPNAEVFVPSSTVYLYWKTDASVAGMWGFKVDSIEYATAGDISFSTNSALPRNVDTTITGVTNLPESSHPYTVNSDAKLWKINTGLPVTGYGWRWIQTDDALVRTTTSKIQQLNDNITLEVERASAAEDSVRSSIETNIKGIRLSTSSGSTSSTISLTYSGTTIDSKSITFTGFATFAGLSGGTTTINGACLTTGTIKSNNGNMTINLDNGQITAKQFSLSSTYLNIDTYGNLRSGTADYGITLENGVIRTNNGTEGSVGSKYTSLEAGKIYFYSQYKKNKNYACSITTNDSGSKFKLLGSVDIRNRSDSDYASLSCSSVSANDELYSRDRIYCEGNLHCGDFETDAVAGYSPLSDEWIGEFAGRDKYYTRIHVVHGLVVGIDTWIK